jgi:hypothetical protein
MYGSGRCSVISFILLSLLVTVNYAEALCGLYALMLRNKYDTNMNMQLFIRLSISRLLSPAPTCKKAALQKLYVSLVRLKPYNSVCGFCNRGCDNWAET